MATSQMIEAAARGPAKPPPSTVHQEANATLHRPRGSHDAEEAERLACVRQVIRMALHRHDCAELPACQAHGQDRCDCAPCRHQRHGDDAALAAETLKMLGLTGEGA